MLVDRKDFPYPRLPGLGAQRADRKFSLRQIIFAHHMIYADRMGRRSVLIAGPGIFIHIAVVKNVFYVIYKILVCFCHHNMDLPLRMPGYYL